MSATQSTAPATVTTTPSMSSRVAEWGPLMVSVLTLFVYLAAITIAWWTKDPSLGILLGVAATNATTVVSFWVGSSKGSQAKDAVIAAQAGAAPAAGTTTTTTVATPLPVSNTGTLP